jgi:alpha-beta hydrolase superfamily lysophospholipase
MKSFDFFFDGLKGTKIYTQRWSPDDSNSVKGAIQISHGMAEHSGRYKEFAEFMTNNGFVVYANDHRGHGKTAGNINNVGFIDENEGWQLVVDDILQLSNIIKEENPKLPIFLLGHSFGSIVARAFLAKYGNTYKGIILSGTTGSDGLLVSAGKFIASMQGFFKGKNKKSQLLNSMTFKDYNKKFQPAKTEFDWLSRDHERNLDYINDPYCGGVFTNRFFFDMLDMISFINKKSSMQNVPTNIPLLFISGEMDPVGEFGKGVKKVYNKYKNHGVKDIELKLYKDGRHESLNEINRQEVFNDILNWLNKHI